MNHADIKSIHANIFTHKLTFYDVEFNTEFMADNGQVYCKTAPNSATKTNAPGSGNICSFGWDDIVWCDPLDIPGGTVTYQFGQRAA